MDILVRKNEPGHGNGDGWHLADVESGEPVLGEFSNQYREFDTREAAVEYVQQRGHIAVFE